MEWDQSIQLTFLVIQLFNVLGFNEIPFLASRGNELSVFARFSDEFKQKSQRFLTDFSHAFLGRRCGKCGMPAVGRCVHNRIQPKPNFVDEKHILKGFKNAHD